MATAVLTSGGTHKCSGQSCHELWSKVNREWQGVLAFRVIHRWINKIFFSKIRSSNKKEA